MPAKKRTMKNVFLLFSVYFIPFSCTYERTCDDPNHEGGNDGAQDLGPVPAKVHGFGGGSLGQPDGEERDHEGGQVREEVGRVRGDGQAPGHVPA